MSERDHKSIATGVIADAERAMADLSGRQADRVNRLRKLNELFEVVEGRYQAMREDLRERDARIQRLEETNDLLLTAVRNLTASIQDSARSLDLSDDDLLGALDRSEALVSETFGTGGNANPTQPPATPPHDTAEDAVPSGGACDAADATEDLLFETDDPGQPDAVLEAAPEAALEEVLDAALEEAEEIIALDPDEPPVASEVAGLALEPAPDPDAATDATSDDANDDAADDAEDAPLVWSDAWTVGAPEIDRDHRIMADLVNQLPQAFRAPESGWVVGSVLNSLWDYTDYHFGREEALLRAANFPGAAEHAGRHTDLKGQLREWLDRYQQDPASVDAPALMGFLKGWLMNHILGEDMRYKPYVEKNIDAQAVAGAIKADPQVIEGLESLGVTAPA
ncbi:bacteriohemerythrin [Roseospira navarrensis]|uniref:Bacteriohemerythrin n=1 Tax=Roseospira navarrensis TaxID=140058 RepID=A0A7X1ZCT5_9PROT|nr:bacteriohemerythrin [Roseospira navarrensis]MQX35967.1 bacteriohemerythrin [Roseospira navarrensis]